ncbi:MAG: NAD-dependent epimerase/dehydratase family protein [Gemmatimonadales bacterium]
MRRALVTGASGLLGSHVVERFAAEGWAVRALVRDVDAARWLEPLGASLARGDITDEQSVHEAAAGCDVVVHAAAHVAPGTDWTPFYEGNVRGTAYVVGAAAAAGSRLVVVGSTAVFDDYTKDNYRPVDEDVPLPDLPADDLYGRSKKEAERAALRAHETGAVWAAVVRPPVMYGARDRQFIPRIAPLLDRGWFFSIDGGQAAFPVVHAGAVADGAVRCALTDAAGGRVYHLTNDFDVSVADFIRLAAEGLSRRIRTVDFSARAARRVFAALGAVLRMAGRGDLADHVPGAVAMFTAGNPFSSERARRELGWRPTVTPDVAVPEAFRWWKTHHGKANATT